MHMTASPTGPQPMTTAMSRFLISERRTACRATAIGSVSVAISVESPFGTDDDLLGIGAGCGLGEPDRVYLVTAPRQRQRYDRRSGGELLAAPRPVVGDLA